jgi:DNA-binding XRE family transcriptional regulator
MYAPQAMVNALLGKLWTHASESLSKLGVIKRRAFAKPANLPPEILKAARNLVGLRQAELAKLADLSPTTVARYEAGLVVMSNESADAIVEVLKRLGIVFVEENESRTIAVGLAKRQPGPEVPE